MDPWRRITSRVPARSWRPSTFCVINRKCGNLRLQSASTRCAAFGSHAAILCRRQSYHSQTNRGSRAKACGVASDSGLKLFHSPSAPRNVGTPLAADTPAPVSTVMRASRVSRRARSWLGASERNSLLTSHELEGLLKPSVRQRKRNQLRVGTAACGNHEVLPALMHERHGRCERTRRRIEFPHRGAGSLV